MKSLNTNFRTEPVKPIYIYTDDLSFYPMPEKASVEKPASTTDDRGIDSLEDIPCFSDLSLYSAEDIAKIAKIQSELSALIPSNHDNKKKKTHQLAAPKRYRISIQTENNIIQKLKNGEKIKSIASELNINEKTVSNYKNKHKCILPEYLFNHHNRKLSVETKKEIMKRRRQGEPPITIAKALNIPHLTVLRCNLKTENRSIESHQSENTFSESGLPPFKNLSSISDDIEILYDYTRCSPSYLFMMQNSCGTEQPTLSSFQKISHLAYLLPLSQLLNIICSPVLNNNTEDKRL
jgi:hypothetical protein